MITGRGPGAPGLTPGLEFTRRRGGPGGTGHGAVDLSEIRRSEELVNRLAARGAAGLVSLDDPAAALLAALSADVDVPAVKDQPAMAPRLAAVGEAVAGAPSRGLADWVRAAVAGAVVAGLAGTTSLITASMVARLSRGAGGRGRGPVARGWARQARSRRYR